MPQRVSVPNLGVVEFPDDMPGDQVSEAIRTHLASMEPPHAWTPADTGLRPPLTGDEKLRNWLHDVAHSAAATLSQVIGPNWISGDLPNPYSKDPAERQRAYQALAQAATGAFGMTVYHGSPHIFDAFDSAKIGTGEGAQAYGHGLYFAENPNVAKEYQRRLTTTIPGAFEGGSKYQIEGAEFPKGRSGHAALDTAQDIEHMLGYRKMGSTDMEQVVKDQIERRIGNFYKTTTGQGSAYEDMDALTSYYIRHAKDAPAEKIFENRGAFYSVDIPDEHINKMLDWDKPFSQQPQAVKDALAKFGYGKPAYYVRGLPFDSKSEAEAFALDRYTNTGEVYKGPEQTGAQIYQDLSKRFGNADIHGDYGNQEAASQVLHEQGIPGIKYLDQASRSQGMTTYTAKWTPDGTGAEVFHRQTGVSQGVFPSFAEADKWIQAHAPKETRNIVVFDPDILGDVKRQ